MLTKREDMGLVYTKNLVYTKTKLWLVCAIAFCCTIIGFAQDFTIDIISKSKSTFLLQIKIIKKTSLRGF